MRALVFALLCLVFSPLLLVGTLAFAFRVRFVNMPRAGSSSEGEAGLRIFEVDEPPTQQVKVEALRAAGVERSHATFAPTDFNQQSWLEQRGIAVDSTWRRMQGKLDGDRYEIEIGAGNASEVILVEVRTRLRSSDIRRFLYKVSRLATSSGACRGRRVYGAVACYRSTRAVRRQAERRGLFVVRATGKGARASILNAQDFSPRVFSSPALEEAGP